MRKYHHRSQGSSPVGKGFSLLEMIIVLVIIAMVMGGAMLAQRAFDDERKMRTVASSFESFSKRARSLAVTQQRPYEIVITRGRMELRPVSNEEARDLRWEDEAEEQGAFEAISDSEDIDPNIAVFVKRWGSDKWIAFEENARTEVVLRYGSNGLCEPVQMRYEMEESWIEETYHPLTGGVSESGSAIY